MPFEISPPSCQSLYLESWRDSLRLANATGFVVKSKDGSPYLITNRHVVVGVNAFPTHLKISHNSNTGLGSFVVKTEPIFINNQQLWHEHPTWGDRADVVAVALADLGDVVLRPYELDVAHQNKISCADLVHVVGFPFGVKTAPSFAIWATGFVASEPQIPHGGDPLFLIDCRTRPGQSGSAVISRVDDRGGEKPRDLGYDLLGVYSGRINAESDLGKVWNVHVISELIEYASISRGDSLAV
jgi:S1-C subfamily serine protease